MNTRSTAKRPGAAPGDNHVDFGAYIYKYPNPTATTGLVVLSLTAILLFAASPLPAADGDSDDTPRFYDPVQREIEGWRVAIDPDLLQENRAEFAGEALKALANHLQRIGYIVPEKQLAQLRTVRLWLELDNPVLEKMQYHPNRQWLVAHGHDPRLVKHVHIPRARLLLDRQTWAKHPYCVLHEMAHAYHDQVLGFDHRQIEAAFKNAEQAGSYEAVLLFTGERGVRHYGLTNPPEYFAESTESYFGVNDFYPFVRAELAEHDPRMFRLLQKIWGPVDEKSATK